MAAAAGTKVIGNAVEGKELGEGVLKQAVIGGITGGVAAGATAGINNAMHEVSS